MGELINLAQYREASLDLEIKQLREIISRILEQNPPKLTPYFIERECEVVLFDILPHLY